MISLLEDRSPVGVGEGQATDRVIQHVRALIARDQLRRGQRLPPERALVRAIGVSRTTVRSGLQSLAAKGVLVIRHGAGTFVADGPPALDSDPLRFLAALHGVSRSEMFEARGKLEVGAAGLAAVRASGDDMAAMADEITSMFRSLDNPQTFLVHDIRFHRAVAHASGNRILASLVEMVSALFYELRRRTAEQGRDRRPAAEQHRQIYQAIRDRDRPRAERLMGEHLLGAEQAQQSEARPPNSTANGAPSPGWPESLLGGLPHRLSR
jgi:GntR family transcriptional regulator, transcriptional repressor for pyruvate dehydrogenase complex